MRLFPLLQLQLDSHESSENPKKSAGAAQRSTQSEATPDNGTPELNSVLQDPSETILDPRIDTKDGLLPLSNDKYVKARPEVLLVYIKLAAVSSVSIAFPL